MSEQFRSRFTPAAFEDFMAGRETQFTKDYPFFHLHLPGVPEAGKDFSREALSLCPDLEAFLAEPPQPGEEGMSPVELKRSRKERHGRLYHRYLTDLHYKALYDDRFYLNIEANGRLWPAGFLLGHIWSRTADGPTEAEVMVINKAPVREDLETGCNLSGSAGKLFQEAVEEVRLTGWDRWYVTNACRFVSPLAHKTDVPQAWLADCRLLLYQEMRIVKPKFILLLGSEALGMVLGKGKNYKGTNGQVHEILLDMPNGAPPHPVKVVTCLNPGAVVHDPSKRDDLLKALAYFRDVYSGDSVAIAAREEDKEYIYCESVEELARVARRMKEERRTEFAIDCEFDGHTPIDGKLHTVQFSWAPKKACVANLRNTQGRITFGGGIENAGKVLADIFRGPEKRIIGHYFNADLWWLKEIGLRFLEDQFEAPADDPDPDGVTRLFGWQKLATSGGFDTMLAAHAHEETCDMGLKELALKHTTIGNYEVDLDAWKKLHASELGITLKQLPGFGACPREILLPYAACDADATFRLYQVYNLGVPGKFEALLDRDRFGRSSRVPFWISMQACLAFYEMHETGVHINRQNAEELRLFYCEVRARLLEELRGPEHLNWPGFNPDSVIECREFLFGEDYNGKIDKSTGRNVRVRPPGALTLNLLPYKSTGKRPKLWDWVRARNKEAEFAAAADKETLEIYKFKHPSIEKLLHLRYISTVVKMVLQPPEMDNGEIVYDDDGEIMYEKGLLSYVQSTGTAHTNFSQTKDTGRASSWQPPLQNISKKREPDYRKICGASYKFPLRSILEAPPGWAYVSADYTGAELLGMAIQSGEKNMIDHCRRALLADKGYSEDGLRCSHGPDGGPDKKCAFCVYPHPDYYDIHANVAVKAFRPTYPDGRPCREGRLARFDLGAAKLSHYRDAAKPVDFGYAYGMTADAAYRKAREGGADVTLDDSQALLDGLEALYPCLPPYYAGLAQRSREPGHVTNCYGRRRRTHYTDDPKTIGDIERKFKNFPIQSLVADAVSLAMGNFRRYRREHPHLKYRLSLQIHDDIVALVPIPQISEFYHKVIPACMTDRVDVWPTDFDGNRRPDPQAPYHLVPDRHVYLRWGMDITKAEAEAKGIPLEFAKQ